MVQVQKVYHMGIPANDLDRARDFYTRVLGFQFVGRFGGQPGPDAEAVDGKYLRLDRYECGPDTVVIFERPHSIDRDAIAQDGITHQAFEVDVNTWDEAVSTAKAEGKFHRTVERQSGKTLYLFDTEGNYLELHFGTPANER